MVISRQWSSGIRHDADQAHCGISYSYAISVSPERFNISMWRLGDIGAIPTAYGAIPTAHSARTGMYRDLGECLLKGLEQHSSSTAFAL